MEQGRLVWRRSAGSGIRIWTNAFRPPRSTVPWPSGMEAVNLAANQIKAARAWLYRWRRRDDGPPCMGSDGASDCRSIRRFAMDRYFVPQGISA